MGFEKTYLWEDPIHSGIVFGSVLVTLISICYYSLISVVAYCSLTALCAVLSLKIYTYVMVTFLKKEANNPLAKFSGNNHHCVKITKFYYLTHLLQNFREINLLSLKLHCCNLISRKIFLVGVNFSFSQ